MSYKSFRTGYIHAFGWILGFSRSTVGTNIWLSNGKGPAKGWFTTWFKFKP